MNSFMNIQHSQSALLHRGWNPFSRNSLDYSQILVTAFAGIVGCQHVKTRVKTMDMCLSGQHVADMLANMLAT
jgi:hypothetical protein